MPSRKAAKNCAILPWLSASVDCKEGRFTQVGNSFLLAFGGKHPIDLSPGARWMYLCMAMESGGKRELIFTHGAGRKYGIKGTSYDRYAKELESKGFIERIEDNNLAQYAPARWRFSFEWKGITSKFAPHPGEG